jgi:hypothetical protein
MEVWIGTPFIPHFECKQEPFEPFIYPKLQRFNEKVEAFGDGSKICSLCFFVCLLLLVTHDDDEEMTRRRGPSPSLL